MLKVKTGKMPPASPIDFPGYLPAQRYRSPPRCWMCSLVTFYTCRQKAFSAQKPTSTPYKPIPRARGFAGSAAPGALRALGHSPWVPIVPRDTSAPLRHPHPRASLHRGGDGEGDFNPWFPTQGGISCFCFVFLCFVLCGI